MANVKESARLSDDLIYDVGMHRGEDTEYYLALGYRVVGFEANPDLVEHCTRCFAAEIEQGRLSIVPGAITTSPAGPVRFYRHPLTVWGTVDEELVKRNRVVAESEAVDVPAVDFTAWLRRTGVPWFMKIDIEGADTICLEALRAFGQRPSYLSVESNQTDWQRLIEEFQLLEELGYNRFAVVQQATIPGSEIRTTTRAGAALDFRFSDDASGPFGVDVGPWQDRNGVIARYRRIFMAYRLLGADSVLRRTKLGRTLPGLATRYLGLPLPGWFDTHAAHETVVARDSSRAPRPG